MLWALPAQGQSLGPLRGPVEEAPLRGNTLANRLTPAAPSQGTAVPYSPQSPGAVPDTAAADAQTDPFAGETLRSSAAPSTARERREARTGGTQPEPDEETAIDNTAAEPLDDVATGTLRAQTIDAQQDFPLDEGAARVRSIEDLERARDENPFSAVGIRAGTFVLRPSLEQGVTATTNASSSTDGSDAILSETTLRLNAVSDWSRHSAALDAYGTFRKTLSGEEIKETEAGIDASLDLDLRDDLRARGELFYLRRPESASSPVFIAGTVSQPIRQTFGGSLGVEKDVGKARFGIAGRVEHDMFGDAELSTGGVLSQKERDSTLATLALRGGYEISPALAPFVELEVGRRFYDQEIDSSGFARSSDRLGARAGVELDLGEKFSGEFSAGWLRESFDDDRLDPIDGPSIGANLSWSPERGTIVNLAATTIIEGTTTPGESGSILHAGRLSVERLIRANLTGNAALGAQYRDYASSNGHDLTLSAEIGATWWLNRYAGLVGRLRHEQQRSNLPGRDYDASSAFLGLRVQR
ncbi:outer membrane beta-barrel protein [Pseudaminobacter sp. NGMCC 1.201702]|uniref:outer membrane beta-barrel protein n=1 Tax=Pseudaminobacter sp. NGMCC 1.201702 TaxID=3391825 RepID=UPI0039EE209D